ncbi:UDP-N-acetylglucosamine 2-epimerase [Acetobacterium bakii]|uniref:UDP-N-acetylglucosamine 2-epimerase (non-hydrolyzing) n=2 Tax=Acetobacterium bakii TaxID=52689 RepID=A0A0L6U5F0_9FIRM|nr:UDP-N-acetylglucosamine 2-epimerase [Acetobacterium bakii]
MVLFGTRPEAIKMAPLVIALKNDSRFETLVTLTAQHREILDQVLEIFSIKSDYDLNLMKPGQTLSYITASILEDLKPILERENPDMILVHGDTTTAFASALSAFYEQIPIGHVEAGLRTKNKYSPFPEEMNRTLIGQMADLDFSPTAGNRDNLLLEDIPVANIVITGNTVIDALLMTVKKDYRFETPVLNTIDYHNRRVILLTSHRRENLGEPMENIFSAIRELVLTNPDIEVVFPMHPNPLIAEKALPLLEELDRVHILAPLDYAEISNLMGRTYLVLTDSGGIQEEAPALGKPVVVLRHETERPEAVAAGTVVMGGVDKSHILAVTQNLLDNPAAYDAMAHAVNPYGDGKASFRICDAIASYFKNKLI